MIHGEKAHSLYFSKDAFKKLTGDNKTLMIISGANHTDLYDNMKYIPMKVLQKEFFLRQTLLDSPFEGGLLAALLFC